MAATRFLKHAFILGLLLPPTGILADPSVDTGAGCTHMIGFDQVVQVRKPTIASQNAIQDTRKIYIDRFGKPKFEKQVPDGIALTWITAEGSSTPIARNVTIQIVEGTVHVTCGTTF